MREQKKKERNIEKICRQRQKQRAERETKEIQKIATKIKTGNVENVGSFSALPKWPPIAYVSLVNMQMQ